MVSEALTTLDLRPTVVPINFWTNERAALALYINQNLTVEDIIKLNDQFITSEIEKKCSLITIKDAFIPVDNSWVIEQSQNANI